MLNGSCSPGSIVDWQLLSYMHQVYYIHLDSFLCYTVNPTTFKVAVNPIYFPHISFTGILFYYIINIQYVIVLSTFNYI